jgi:hypothetical protein
MFFGKKFLKNIDITEALKEQLKTYCNKGFIGGKATEFGQRELNSDSFEFRLKDGKYYHGEVKNGSFEKSKHFISINEPLDKDGNTALHHAALNGNIKFFNELINAGARMDIENKNKELAINIKNTKGEFVKDKALIEACAENNHKLAIRLIKEGKADIYFKDSEGESPINYFNKKANNYQFEDPPESPNQSPRFGSEPELPNPSPETVSALRILIQETLEEKSSTGR